MYKDTNFEPKETDMKVRATPHLRTILDYFEKNLKKGYKLDDLKYMLLSQGYSKTEVGEAIKIMEEKRKKDQEVAKKEEEKRLKMQIHEEIKQVNEQQKKGFFGRLFGK